MTVIICRPDVFLIRRIQHCPNCNRRRRFIGCDQAWYGAMWTCCACGDQWGSDGYRMDRPFRPRWRKDRTRVARARWDAAGPYDKRARMTWIREQVMGEKS